MSDTPRTDAEVRPGNLHNQVSEYVPASFARTLELELSTLQQQHEQLKAVAKELEADKRRMDWLSVPKDDDTFASFGEIYYNADPFIHSARLAIDAAMKTTT